MISFSLCNLHISFFFSSFYLGFSLASPFTFFNLKLAPLLLFPFLTFLLNSIFFSLSFFLSLHRYYCPVFNCLPFIRNAIVFALLGRLFPLYSSSYCLWLEVHPSFWFNCYVHNNGDKITNRITIYSLPSYIIRDLNAVSSQANYNR